MIVAAGCITDGIAAAGAPRKPSRRPIRHCPATLSFTTARPFRSPVIYCHLLGGHSRLSASVLLASRVKIYCAQSEESGGELCREYGYMLSISFQAACICHRKDMKWLGTYKYEIIESCMLDIAFV